MTTTEAKPTGAQHPTGYVLSEEPTVHPTARIKDSVLGKWTQIGPNASIAESTIGDYTYLVDSTSTIYAEIGKFCSIASHTRINPGNHPMHRATQHHMTYRRIAYGFGDEDDLDFFQWRRDAKVVVGHDVWMGHGVVVLPGVTIGTGAVIAAGAVVSKDVEPYTVVGGVPAQPIKERFPREIAEAMQRVAWWDWSRELLEEQFEDLSGDAAAFVEKYG